MVEAERLLIRSWLAKAESDLAAARKLAAGSDPCLDAAIYHCQQAAEKAVKGFLTFHHQEVVKTHDVRYLCKLAVSFNKDFSTWFEAAELVTPYATLYRYPGEDLEPEQEEFDQALTAAEGLCSFVLSVLPEEVHPDKSHRQSQDKRNSATAVESAVISAEADPPPNVPPESSTTDS